MIKTDPAVLYWDKGVEAVPVMTGASSVLDGSDMVAICGQLGLELPLVDVLDVGCGTGRLARICDGYVGVDIAPSAVEYCRRQGLTAYTVLEFPKDGRRFGLVACLSVFTHIDRKLRRRYLKSFASITDRVLVDIIAGKEGGDIRLWRADRSGFMADLLDAGFGAAAETQGVGVSSEHTYFSAVKL